MHGNQSKFPPLARTKEHTLATISKYCNDVNMKAVKEEGCAVCGRLTPLKDMKSLESIKDNLSLLEQAGVTRIERKSANDPIKEITGPILAPGCRSACKSCHSALAGGTRPKHALANGLWIGEVPPVLAKLRFAERMLISRVRHNYCVVKVASGGRKLKANAIMFASPMQKVYSKLPPPIDELDDVLAYIFTGPARPTPEEMKRTPLLVRRNAVAEALNWLILNHTDYADIQIDHTALRQYPEDDAPVTIFYHPRDSNKNVESKGLDDMEVEDGTQNGECVFTVHGLTGTQLENISSTK
ncbi:hypothetical protein CPC08DRAFT_648282, partial [Agrocybe pediades]